MTGKKHKDFFRTLFFKMIDCGLSCFAWFAGIILGVYLLFQYFKKNIFAAFCSNMAKGPMFRKEKGELFIRLNEQAKKAGPKKLKVTYFALETIG